MAMITRFDDIQAWQEGRKLVKMIDKLSNAGMLAKDFSLRDQIQRAAVRFAHRSAVEIQSLLYIVFDTRYITEA